MTLPRLLHRDSLPAVRNRAAPAVPRGLNREISARGGSVGCAKAAYAGPGCMCRASIFSDSFLPVQATLVRARVPPLLYRLGVQ